MRIAVLTTSYPRFEQDEAGVFIKRLVEAYNEAGAAGVVIVPRDRGEPEREQQNNFTIRRYRYGLFRSGQLAFGSGIKPNLKSRPLLLLQLPLLTLRMTWEGWLARRQFDVVHANWLIAGAAALLLKWITGRRYVLTVRGEEVLFFKRAAVRPILWLILKGASRVTAVSVSALEPLRENFPQFSGKFSSIPNGVSRCAVSAEAAGRFQLEKQLPRKLQYLLFVGTLVPRKRVETLIQLLAEPGLELFGVIPCGRTEESSYLNKLRSLAVRLGCVERVFFQGAVAPGEIPYYLALSRFYVTASAFEGRPNAVLEAMAAGRVVFASDIAAHREVIRPGINGYLFQPEQVSQLARQLLQAGQASADTQGIARCAYAAVESFTWPRCAESYLDCFRR